VLPVILALTCLKYPLQAAGWRLALPAGHRPPWWPSIRATLAGDAVGYLTIAGPISGEPLRAALLRRYLPVSVGITVGVVERTLYSALGALVIAVAFVVAGVRPGRHHWMPYLPVAAGGLCLAAVWIIARPPRRGTSSSHAAGWRAVLHRLWSERRSTVALIALLCLAQHLVLIAEAFTMLTALGAAPSVGTVLVFEGVTKAVNSVGVIVPGRLAIAEGGSAAMAGALGIGASFGLSLALMRRVRALFWGAVGLSLVLPDLWRLSRSTPDTHHATRDGHGEVPRKPLITDWRERS
jgi:uncharacterized membrane protein YbhN (UPF0104 family)